MSPVTPEPLLNQKARAKTMSEIADESTTTPKNLAAFIWANAEILRGAYKPHEYGSIILPFTVLRRLDCVLGPTKQAVLEAIRKNPDDEAGVYAQRASGYKFWNKSKFDFLNLAEDPRNLRANLLKYVEGFSDNIEDIFTNFGFEGIVDDLNKKDRLLLIFQKFQGIDLHPKQLSNADMGLVFEELIRRFAEMSNETAGEHFTPREVIRLMVELLLSPDSDALSKPGVVRTLYDPTAGTGGMLSIAEEHLKRLNPKARLTVFGQEINPESFSICKADMLIKEQSVDNIALGDTLKDDEFSGKHFDYCLANPPYGVDWKASKDAVEREHSDSGFQGRFGAGVPRISDGQLLFVQHMLAHIKPAKSDGTGGGRVCVVLNGSPLFTGRAGSGESNVRGWMLKNDYVEAIVALPEEMFYNTGISTYIWLLTNRKEKERKGKVQLINAASFFRKMRKGLGDKRNELSAEDISKVVRLYGEFKENEFSKIFNNDDFSYSEIVIERPLRQNYSASADRVGRLDDAKGVGNLQGKELEALKAALSKKIGSKAYSSEAAFRKVLDGALKEAAIVLRDSQIAKLLNLLADSDLHADPVLSGGKLVADKSRRDTENVPFGQDIQEFFDREVKPYVPDAWISEEPPTIGYAIPFTSHFFKYQPPRPVKAIDDNLNELALEITELLKHSAERSVQIAQAVTRGLDPKVPLKDSGVDWLGRVPKHWDVRPLFAEFDEHCEKNVGLKETRLLSLSYGKIIEKDISRNEGLLPESFETYQIVEEGDIILRLTDLQNDQTSLRTGLVPFRGIITSAYVNLRTRGRLIPAYACYLLHACDVTKVFYSLGGGVRQGMDFSDLKHLGLVCPPKNEQSAIVSYLDMELEKMASLVSKQEQMIELLRARRSALVTQVVTGQVRASES